MIWTIAKKEIHETLISLRFALLFVLAVIFIPISLYTNHRAYLSRLADQQQIEQRNQDYVRKLRPAQIFTNPNFTLDVYWPPAPASVFAAGFEEAHPRHLVVGKHSVEFGAPLDVRSSSGLFGSIDYLFIVQFIFSLFAVLLSFDAITREKEHGTLRSILSNPLGRAALVSGKLLGGYSALAIPLLVAFLTGIIVLAVAGLNVFSGDFSVRAGWILTSSLLYIAVFFLLGLLVSCLVSSTYAALVVSLAVWLTAALVLPRAASLASQLWKPVTSRQATWLQKLAAVNSIEQDKGRALQELADRAWVTNTNGNKVPGDDWPQKRRAVAMPYEERAAQVVKRIEDEYHRRKAGQRRLGLSLARFSPAGSLANFVTEMADTGIGAEERFIFEADRYRETLTHELFGKFYRDVFPGGGVSMGTSGLINPADLPAFRLARPRISQSLSAADLAILLVWFLATATLTYGALARYDVR
jgi:ABC-type transport system involved in multi-copper enzyme maturation permease subunit